MTYFFSAGVPRHARSFRLLRGNRQIPKPRRWRVQLALLGSLAVLSVLLLSAPLVHAASGWQTAPALPAPRNDFGATTGSDGTLYVIGGFNGSAVVNTVYRFKPGTDTAWQTAPSLPAVRAGLAAITGADGTLYAIGGTPGGGSIQSTVFSFNPATDTDT